MKKYSISINNKKDEFYTLILREYFVDSEGNENNLRFRVEDSITLEECLIIQNEFING